MRIQVITGRKELKNVNDIIIANYDRPQALDEFDVNILDLAYKKLWRSESPRGDFIDEDNNMRAVRMMLDNSNETKLVIVYPQNEQFLYDFDEDESRYFEKSTIKDLVNVNDGHLAGVSCFPGDGRGPTIIFEPTNTLISNKKVGSDFHFIGNHWGNPLTESIRSKKATTIRYRSNVFCTTLNICESIDLIKEYIESIFEEEKPEVPVWVKNYSFDDDDIQRENIKQCEEQIHIYEDKKRLAQAKLEENNKFKSILFQNGPQLVSVIFEMLEEMLDCDLSEFVDENEEDFLVEKDDMVFIGEIKGITSNVKNEFVSQLDVHYQKYLERNPDLDKSKEIHPILIINPFRNKNIVDREPVHENQIKLAIRNESLIVETHTLLKMFEKYQKGILSSQDCIDILSRKTGLLVCEDFEDKNENNTAN